MCLNRDDPLLIRYDKWVRLLKVVVVVVVVVCSDGYSRQKSEIDSDPTPIILEPTPEYRSALHYSESFGIVRNLPESPGVGQNGSDSSRVVRSRSEFESSVVFRSHSESFVVVRSRRETSGVVQYRLGSESAFETKACTVYSRVRRCTVF